MRFLRELFKVNRKMEAEELVDQINDFLPLLPENIKQELLDSNEKGNNLCDSAETKVKFF